MLTEDMVRDFIQDDPRYNLLLDNKEQFGEDVIESMINMTYQEAGALVPALMHSTKQIPAVIILHGVVSNLMRSEGFKELRNQLQYSDSNLSSVSVFHKSTNYMQVAAEMKAEFARLLSSHAKARFLQESWGGTSSNSRDYEALYVFTGNTFFGGIL